jgi:hypothetical protein
LKPEWWGAPLVRGKEHREKPVLRDYNNNNRHSRWRVQWSSALHIQFSMLFCFFLNILFFEDIYQIFLIFNDAFSTVDPA